VIRSPPVRSATPPGARTSQLPHYTKPGGKKRVLRLAVSKIGACPTGGVGTEQHVPVTFGLPGTHGATNAPLRVARVSICPGNPGRPPHRRPHRAQMPRRDPQDRSRSTSTTSTRRHPLLRKPASVEGHRGARIHTGIALIAISCSTRRPGRGCGTAVRGLAGRGEFSPGRGAPLIGPLRSPIARASGPQARHQRRA